MATPSEIIRADLYRQIIELCLTEEDMTIEKACQKVGVSRRTFYSWVASDNDAMLLVRQALGDTQRAALFDFSQTLYAALSMMLADAVDSKKKPETRLKVMKFLLPLFDEYAKVHHAAPGGEDQAPFLKQGPVLEHAQSRLATLDIAVDENGVRIDIMQDKPIIDGIARDSE